MIWRTDDEDPTLWRSVAIAVRAGYEGQGIGTQMKQWLLDRARDAGAYALISFVHRRNGRMLALNAALGAETISDPTNDQHYVCTFRFR